jgi:hypothetical protein
MPCCFCLLRLFIIVVSREHISYFYAFVHPALMVVANALAEQRPIDARGRLVLLKYITPELVGAENVNLVKRIFTLTLCRSWRGLPATKLLEVRSLFVPPRTPSILRQEMDLMRKFGKFSSNLYEEVFALKGLVWVGPDEFNDSDGDDADQADEADKADEQGDRDHEIDTDDQVDESNTPHDDVDDMSSGSGDEEDEEEEAALEGFVIPEQLTDPRSLHIQVRTFLFRSYFDLIIHANDGIGLVLSSQLVEIANRPEFDRDLDNPYKVLPVDYLKAASATYPVALVAFSSLCAVMKSLDFRVIKPLVLDARFWDYVFKKGEDSIEGLNRSCCCVVQVLANDFPHLFAKLDDLTASLDVDEVGAMNGYVGADGLEANIEWSEADKIVDKEAPKKKIPTMSVKEIYEKLMQDVADYILATYEATGGSTKKRKRSPYLETLKALASALKSNSVPYSFATNCLSSTFDSIKIPIRARTLKKL